MLDDERAIDLINPGPDGGGSSRVIEALDAGAYT